MSCCLLWTSAVTADYNFGINIIWSRYLKKVLDKNFTSDYLLQAFIKYVPEWINFSTSSNLKILLFEVNNQL